MKPAQKIQALELLLQACDEAGKVALALTDKHVGCNGRNGIGISSSAASKVSTHCSVLSRLQDMHILLEGGGAATSKRTLGDADGRPPLHPADAAGAAAAATAGGGGGGGSRSLPPSSTVSTAPNPAVAAVPSLRLIAASLKQPLQSSRITCSDFLRHCTHILKDVQAPVAPITSAPSTTALRNEIRCSLGIDRLSAGDAPLPAEVESAVKEGSDSIVAAVTAIGDAAAAFPWYVKLL